MNVPCLFDLTGEDEASAETAFDFVNVDPSIEDEDFPGSSGAGGEFDE